MSATFSDGIDQLNVGLKTWLDGGPAHRWTPLMSPSTAGGRATHLHRACFGDGASAPFPADASAEPFTGSWLPRSAEIGEPSRLEESEQVMP